MPFPVEIPLALAERPGLALIALIAFLVVGYVIGKPIYNVLFHPLHKFPGPKLWAASRIPYAIAIFKGRPHLKILKLHEQYGPIIRVAPDELSFQHDDAWKEIMGHRKGGRGEHGKDPPFYLEQTKGILASDRENHARQRRILAHGFSAQSMADQQPLIKEYVDLLLQQLRERCEGGMKALNMVSWYNWTTFDVIGDLAFGEPFGCLKNADYHPQKNFTLAESFIPERWLGDARFVNDKKDILQPFSFGPRNCLGKNLGYAEMRLILARILWNFDPKLDESSRDWLDQEEYTLWDKKPLNVYLTPRKTG
ncbi:putative cytochrome p450 protein [Eutypa lata UCREL1]|uniref:Putative cytochrome p450 protein n=1 Tax=Eutypa lata (strain UCR-EL1) TaxID=1287681 RepID=M7SC60_EUTLA|nr:putative cytochrome p450 protein [Eutypa lata UCREL1]